MKKGFLSEYFEGVAYKRLSAVEVNHLISNQHEFNGTTPLKNLLGPCAGAEKRFFSSQFMYLNDTDETVVAGPEKMTWYDSRAQKTHRSPECRLYYPSNAVSSRASEGDLLVIARRRDGSLLSLIAQRETTAEQQVRWLFGITEAEQSGFSFRSEEDSDAIALGLPAKFLLEQIGVEIEAPDDSYLEEMLRKFNGKFPPMKVFSAYARTTLRLSSSVDAPDEAVLAWWEREEILFKTLERKLIEERLKEGLDPEGFLQFSLSIHQRRKSRAGDALENHVEQVFLDHGIAYSRGKYTEKRSKPDFIFPDIEHYTDPDFQATRLSMLAVKSTCKDRWRQVLTEAQRIDRKHLLTLEPGISEHQTDEMQTHDVQLVLPKGIHGTYSVRQQHWLLDIGDFISLVRARQ